MIDLFDGVQRLLKIHKHMAFRAVFFRICHTQFHHHAICVIIAIQILLHVFTPYESRLKRQNTLSYLLYTRKRRQNFIFSAKRFRNVIIKKSRISKKSN